VFLAEHSIEQNPNLPLIEDLADLTPPTADEVARRILVLSAQIAISYGAERPALIEYLKSHALWEAASQRERALLEKERYTPQEEIDATWLTECVQVLAWGLGFVQLDPFRACDPDLASHVPTPRASPAEWIAAARLRPFEEIYGQCDLLYCLHWAVREAQRHGEPPPVDGGVILERHRAINWLAGVERDWDEVTTDT